MKKLRKILGSQNYSKGLTRSQQNQFAQTMGELLLSGFSLQESLYLLLTIRSFPACYFGKYPTSAKGRASV